MPYQKISKTLQFVVPLSILICLICCNSLAPKVGPVKTDIINDLAEVPIGWEYGQPVIKATVNGHGPYQFLLDTGVTGLVVSDRVAVDIALPETNMKIDVITPIGNKVLVEKVVHISELCLNDKVTFYDLNASIYGHSVFDDLGIACDGIIGIQVFRDCLLQMNFPDNKLQLSYGDLIESSTLGTFRVKMTRTGVFSIPVIVGLETEKPIILELTLDTGFTGGISIPNSANLQGIRSTYVGETEFVSLGGTHRVKLARLRTKVAVGNAIVIDDPTVSYIEHTGRIGMELLKSAIVTIDQRNQHVRLVPSNN